MPGMNPESQPKTGMPLAAAAAICVFTWFGSALTITIASVFAATASSMRLAIWPKSPLVSMTFVFQPFWPASIASVVSISLVVTDCW